MNILENEKLLELINTFGETEVSIIFDYITSMVFTMGLTGVYEITNGKFTLIFLTNNKTIFKISNLIQLHFLLSQETANNYIIAYGIK